MIQKTSSFINNQTCYQSLWQLNNIRRTAFLIDKGKFMGITGG